MGDNTKNLVWSESIPHHEFDFVELEITNSAPEITVELTVQDRHDGFSTANSRITLTVPELLAILKKVEKFTECRDILLGANNA